MVSPSPNKLAYQDCFELLDRALADPKGVRVPVASVGDAHHMRGRIHAARRSDRETNIATYDMDHPMYGQSQYDLLVVRIKEIEGRAFVYIEQLQYGQVESLSELDANSA